MALKEITSLQHPVVKNCVKLRTNRNFRYEKRQIVLSGKKMVREAGSLETLFLKKGTSSHLKADQIFFVTEAILKKISGLETPENIAAIAPMPNWKNLKDKNWIIALDGISDPGNMGTLLRTALALGWEGAFLTESCVDPYNDKALRAAKGATFRLPLQIGNEEKLDQLASGKKVWIADIAGEPFIEIPKEKKGVLILGNEAHGVSQSLKRRYPLISIPIHGIESLNVAAAGAILLYGLKK